MRENYRGNKRRKEEKRRKKQEDKRNKRLNKNAENPLPDPSNSGSPEGDGALGVTPTQNP